MALAATILVVDDDPEIRDLLRDYLSVEGHRVLLAESADAALALLERGQVDCMLVDVMMPGRSGFELCREVRERSDMPVLFLSARQDDGAKLRGLGLGADDYIVKSSSPAEVAARVRAVLRRYRRGEEGHRSVRLEYGRLTIDLTAREVLVEGHPVPLTAKEFDLLRLLAEHPRQVFTRELVVDHLWDGYGDPQAVNGLVNRLRAKIERDPGQPALIVTVWGVGYRFEGRRES